MPGRDGTGPMSAGSMSGRGLGLCTGTDAAKYGAGFGMGLGLACRRGFARGLAVGETSPKAQKELLQKQKDRLQNRLEVIEKRLENL